MLWIQNCLNRTAEDRKEDGKSSTFLCRKWQFVWKANGYSCCFMIMLRLSGFSQAVPLVPLTEENEEAMENKSFKKLLRKLGMRAPANEQVCLIP